MIFATYLHATTVMYEPSCMLDLLLIHYINLLCSNREWFDVLFQLSHLAQVNWSYHEYFSLIIWTTEGILQAPLVQHIVPQITVPQHFQFSPEPPGSCGCSGVQPHCLFKQRNWATEDQTEFLSSNVFFLRRTQTSKGVNIVL